MERKFLLGVYDQLRRKGDANFSYLGEATYLGTIYTEPNFDMFAITSHYPGLVKGSTSILLEIFEVNEEDLKIADFYEGASTAEKKVNPFNRVEIDTIYGECFIYEYSGSTSRSPKIEIGDWFKYKKNLRELVFKANNINPEWQT